jgi:hypothetical protein
MGQIGAITLQVSVKGKAVKLSGCLETLFSPCIQQSAIISTCTVTNFVK